MIPLGRVFANPGRVAVRGPSYLGAFRRFCVRACSPFDMDEEGIRTDLLEQSSKELTNEQKSKFIYRYSLTLTTAGITMSMPRRPAPTS